MSRDQSKLRKVLYAAVRPRLDLAGTGKPIEAGVLNSTNMMGRNGEKLPPWEHVRKQGQRIWMRETKEQGHRCS